MLLDAAVGKMLLEKDVQPLLHLQSPHIVILLAPRLCFQIKAN